MLAPGIQQTATVGTQTALTERRTYRWQSPHCTRTRQRQSMGATCSTRHTGAAGNGVQSGRPGALVYASVVCAVAAADRVCMCVSACVCVWGGGRGVSPSRDALLRASPHLLPVLVKCSPPLSPQVQYGITLIAARDYSSAVLLCWVHTVVVL